MDNLFRKTLREVQLESEVAALTRKIYEIEMKSGLFSYRDNGKMVTDAAPAQLIELPKVTADLTAITTIKSRITERNGLEVQAWGRTTPEKSLFVQYFIDRDKFWGIESHHNYAPQLLAQQHEQFLLVLAGIKDAPNE